MTWFSLGNHSGWWTKYFNLTSRLTNGDRKSKRLIFNEGVIKRWGGKCVEHARTTNRVCAGAWGKKCFKRFKRQIIRAFVTAGGSEQKCLLGLHSSDDFSRFWLQRQSEKTEMKDIHERIQYEVDHLVENVKYFQSHHSQKTSALADTTAGLLRICHDNNNRWIRLNFDVTCGLNKVPGDTGVPCDHVDLCGRLPRRYF